MRPFPFAVWPNELRKSDATVQPPKNFASDAKLDHSFDVTSVAPYFKNNEDSVRNAAEATHGIVSGKYLDRSGNAWFAKPGGIGRPPYDSIPLGPAALDEHRADMLYRHVFTGRDGKPLSDVPSYIYSGRNHELLDVSHATPADMPYRVTPFLSGNGLTTAGHFHRKTGEPVPEAAQRRFSEGTVVDGLLDSIDMHGENWMFDKDGKVYRIDNGATFGRRGGGQMMGHEVHGRYWDPNMDDYFTLPSIASPVASPAEAWHTGWLGLDPDLMTPKSGEEYIEHANRAIRDFDRKKDVVKKIFATDPRYAEFLEKRIDVLRRMVRNFNDRPDELFSRIRRIRFPRTGAGINIGVSE